MRRALLAAAVLAVCSALPAIAAPSDPAGKRVATPAQILATMDQGDPMAELQREVAAASAHPLGSIDNPVRANGPEGAHSYLARLRCADGNPPRVGPVRRGGVGAFGSVVDLYQLDCGTAAPGRASLLIDIYHEEHVEDQPPAGFTIAPR